MNLLENSPRNLFPIKFAILYNFSVRLIFNGQDVRVGVRERGEQRLYVIDAVNLILSKRKDGNLLKFSTSKSSSFPPEKQKKRKSLSTPFDFPSLLLSASNLAFNFFSSSFKATRVSTSLNIRNESSSQPLQRRCVRL